MAIDLSAFDSLPDPTPDLVPVPFVDRIAGLSAYEFARDLAAAGSFGETQMLLHDRFASHPQEFYRSTQFGDLAPAAYWGDPRTVARDARYVVGVQPALYHSWSLPDLNPNVASMTDVEFGTMLAENVWTGQFNSLLLARLRSHSNEFARITRDDDQWQWNLSGWSLDLSRVLGDFAEFVAVQ